MRSTTGRRLATGLCVFVLLLMAVPALAAAALPKAPSLTGSPMVKPTSMQIVAIGSPGEAPKLPTIIGGKQTGNHSGPLQWKTWNKTKAVVDAYIYEGTKKGYASTVTLTKPKSIDGELVFSRLSSSGGGPTAKISHQPGPGGSTLEWAPAG